MLPAFVRLGQTPAACQSHPKVVGALRGGFDRLREPEGVESRGVLSSEQQQCGAAGERPSPAFPEGPGAVRFQNLPGYGTGRRGFAKEAKGGVGFASKERHRHESPGGDSLAIPGRPVLFAHRRVRVFAQDNGESAALAGDVARDAMRIGMHAVANRVAPAERRAGRDGAEQHVVALWTIDARVVSAGGAETGDSKGYLGVAGQPVALEQTQWTV